MNNGQANGNKGAYPCESNQAKGLTKREYFAGLAMQGAMACDSAPINDYQRFAQMCIKVADALLAELEKPQS